MGTQSLWLFDSPLLRDALADSNLPAVPAIVRAACGLSQRDLAAVVGWSGAALSYYERGRRDGMFDVRSILQFADAIGMPRAALAPLIFADPDAGAPARAGATVGAPALVTFMSGPRSVTTSHIRYWRACTTALYARVGQVGGIASLPLAIELWQRVHRASRPGGRSEVGGQLPDAAGEAALCVAFIAMDAGHADLAQSLVVTARNLADQAGDAVLAVRALADESAVLIGRLDADRDSAQQALRLIFQAQEEARYLAIPRLHALIALRHASAASRLDLGGAFHDAIARARHELERCVRRDNLPGWQQLVSDTAVTAAEADGSLSLGDAARSAALYRQLLMSGLSERQRASCGAGLASALMARGLLTDAVTAATEILPAVASGVAPAWCLDQLRAVRQAVGSAPSADDFRDRFDAIKLPHTDLGDFSYA